MSVMLGDNDLEDSGKSQNNNQGSRCKTCNCEIDKGHMFCDECLESYYSGILEDLWKGSERKQWLDEL